MKLVRNGALAIAGLAVGLVLAEGAFWVRDGGAFPHVNFYSADDVLGARLQPDRSQRISFGGNPVTSIATNAQGYRTPAWPAPAETDVLVVGDSQVFGLGVEEGDSLPAQLGTKLGSTVLNGGVPTYGPQEYLAVVEEVASERDLGTVVFVVNYSNDLFEVSRPNRDRHVIWDGWAVRSETAPASVTQFPGRSWLYSQSHLVFALRKLWHRASDDGGQGFASEGTKLDVVTAAAESNLAREQQQQVISQKEEEATDAYASAVGQLGDLTAMAELYGRLAYENDNNLKLQAVLENHSVGDIVNEQYAESSRHILVTAEILQEGAQIRRNLRHEVRKLAAERPDDRWVQQQLQRALGTVDELDPTLAQLEIEPSVQTPLDGILDQLHTLSQTHGFEVVVVALPLDVQVLPSQFEKYGGTPVDLSDTHILFEDLRQAAALRGMRFALPVDALRRVGDAAWLDKDLHHTAAGNDAVAGAIAEVMAKPPAPPLPGPGIPKGRSRVPWPEEWTAARENLVRGSTRNRCMTRRIREWFRMDCRRYEGLEVEGLRFVDVPRETMAWKQRHGVVVVMPVLGAAQLDIVWADRTERLHIEDDLTTMAFRPAEPAEPMQGVKKEARLQLLTPDATLDAFQVQWFGAGRHCTDLACLTGKRTSPPTCPDGLVNAGSAAHCLTPCIDRCDEGVCKPWGGSKVCL